VSHSNEALDLFQRGRDRLDNYRDRFETLARRYRALADTAHPDFKQQYLDLAVSIEAYLQQFPRPLSSSAEETEQ
jgi:hypothetical protein